MKKYLSLTLCIIMLLSTLSACIINAPVDTTVTDAIKDTFDSLTDSIQHTDGTEPPPVSTDVTLTAGRKAEYTVVFASDIPLDVINEMKDILTDLSLNHDILLYSSIDRTYMKDNDVDKEILVGNVNRREMKALAGEILNGEYVIRYNDESTRVSILGSTTDLTVEAFKYFFETFADKENHTVTVPRDLRYSYRGEYDLLSVAINGIDIDEYVMVVPENDIYAIYTAVNIADYFSHKLGAEVKIVDDSAAETENEILIGDTNRDEDDTETLLEAGQYFIRQENGKIVMRGYGVYVAAAMGKLVAENLADADPKEAIDITNIPEAEEVLTYIAPKDAKNAVLMIGDGMGYNHVNAALNRGLGEFAAESFIYHGEAVTRSQSVINGDAGYTDSAAAATALSTGYKTINGYLGKSADGNNVLNVRELAHIKGAKTAVVTTDTITGATPAGFLVHNISRNNTADIQADIDSLVENGLVDYCAGDVGDDLTEHVGKALNTIAYTDAPFFMMVEEGIIDKRSHDNKKEETLDMVERFNDVIIYVACFALIDGETALIVTADHETGGLTADESSTYGYKFTSVNHTNVNVPIYAIGAETVEFDGVTMENIQIAKYLAKQYGSTSFGQ